VTLVERDVNQSDVYGGRADLLLTPTDELKLRIAAFAQDISRDGEGTSDYSFNGRPLVNSLTSVRHIEEPFDQQLRTISATLNYDLGAAQLTTISSYEYRDSVYHIDATPLLLPFLTALGSFSGVGNGNSNETSKFVQEARLSGQGRLLDWVVGGYYTTEDNETGSYYVLRDLAGQPAPNNVSTVLDAYDFDEHAAFGTLTWHITDKLDASGGVRYSQNHQSYEQNGVGPFSVSAPRVHSNGSATTYLANLRYSISVQSMIYARYATGYRPGGPNNNSRDLVTGEVKGPADFDADMLDSYEIGYKGETEDRRWAIDVAVYYIDWDNVVIRVYNATSNISYYDNAAGMKVKGGELALTARPTDGLSIVGSFTYTDSFLTEANTDLGAAKEERMPTVPRYIANLSADYTFDSGWLPTIGASFRNVGDRHASFDQNPGFPQYVLPSYSALDVRAGLDVNQYSIRLYVRNVLDERGELSAYTWQGNPRPALLQPRTVGLTVTTRF
jgi:outer membrane receptor protein involved in Fe transport